MTRSSTTSSETQHQRQTDPISFDDRCRFIGRYYKFCVGKQKGDQFLFHLGWEPLEREGGDGRIKNVTAAPGGKSDDGDESVKRLLAYRNFAIGRNTDDAASGTTEEPLSIASHWLLFHY